MRSSIRRSGKRLPVAGLVVLTLATATMPLAASASAKHSPPPSSGPVRVTVGDVTVHEGSGARSATVTIAATRRPSSNVDLVVSTAEAEATSADYTPLSGVPARIQPNRGWTTVEVPILDDALDEPDEAFRVRIDSASSSAQVAVPEGTVTIVDDDPAAAKPVVSIGDATVFEGDQGDREAVFAVTLSKPSNKPVLVAFATGDGSATRANNDYSLRFGLVTFRPGKTFQTISVPVRADETKEPDEDFFVRFWAAGATTGDNEGRGLIRDDDSVDFVLTLLHNNDGESKLLRSPISADFGGAARFKTLVDQLKANAETSLLPSDASDAARGTVMLSSGDNYLAGPEFNASIVKGVPFYDSILASAVGYDAMIVGNHEFDFGPATLADYIEGIPNVPFLSANLDVSGDPDLQALAAAGRFVPSAVVEKGGRKIGFIGAVTEVLPSISSPGGVVVNPVKPAVQAEIDKLTAQGVEIIVLASQLQDVTTELALVSELRGLDIVISGGGDELLLNPWNTSIPATPPLPVRGPYPLRQPDADGKAVPVITTSGDYNFVGRLLVGFDADGNVISTYDPAAPSEYHLRSGPVRVSGVAPDAVAHDPQIKAEVVDPVAASVAALAANVIGQSQVPLDGTNVGGFNIRAFETNLGNLTADSLLWQAQQLAAGVGVDAPVVALQNGGGIRNNSVLTPGATPGSPQNLTELNTFNVYPFANFVSVVEDVTAARLEQLLEHSVAAKTSASSNGQGQWGHWAGLRYTFDTALPAQTTDLQGNVTAPGSRIRDVVLDDGTVLYDDGLYVGPDTDSTFTIDLATIDFTARGGDRYPFVGLSFTNLATSYQRALFNYIVTGLSGLVTAADYPAGGEGRIQHAPIDLV